jgi:hypothetical protein
LSAPLSAQLSRWKADKERKMRRSGTLYPNQNKMSALLFSSKNN